jgi:hypothetical protein
MADVIKSYKDQLAKAFSDANARMDSVGNETFGNFNNIQTENSENEDKKPRKKKSENKEATGTGGGGYSMPLFGTMKKEETKEATGSSSSGSYVTPAAWAKSTKKKDWRGASKPLIPGGKFVQVKKRCKTFPYCNQGDIKSLKIWENKMVKDVIEKISDKYNINETLIKRVIVNEIQKSKNK